MPEVLDTLLAIALLGLAGSAIYAIWIAVGTMKSTRVLVERLDERLPTLIDRATGTLDTVDREMERVDGIVTRFEDVSETVSTTTRVAGEVVRAPIAKLAGVGGGLRAIFGSRRRS